MKNCFAKLPENYKLVYEINAKNKKTGIIMNLVAALPAILFAVIALLTKDLSDVPAVSSKDLILAGVKLICFALSMLAYIILHELTHGAAYKILTGAKLKFGLSWSCAFCGVPEVYVNKKTALIALSAPLILFGIVFAALSVLFWFFDPLLYIFAMILLGLHLGGCSGDIYMIYLLCFKYNSPSLLLNDDGPSQRIFYPDENYIKPDGEKENKNERLVRVIGIFGEGANKIENKESENAAEKSATIEEIPENK